MCQQMPPARIYLTRLILTGGHTTELLLLLKDLNFAKNDVVFFVADSDIGSIKKAKKFLNRSDVSVYCFCTCDFLSI